MPKVDHPNKSRDVTGEKYSLHVIHCLLWGKLNMISMQVHDQDGSWLGAEAINLEKEKFWENAEDPYYVTAQECLDRLLARPIIPKLADRAQLNEEFNKEYSKIDA